jgi:hypothetical protein
MKLNFKNWFQNEVATAAAPAGGSGGMTSTADVAKFARPLGMGMVTRTPPTLLTVDDLEKKKNKKKIKF